MACRHRKKKRSKLIDDAAEEDDEVRAISAQSAAPATRAHRCGTAACRQRSPLGL